MVVCPLERFHSTDKAAAGHPSIPTRRREGRHKAAENHPKITPCLRKLEFPSLIIGVQLTQITFHIELEFWGKNRTERAAQAILDWKSLPRQRLQVSAGNRPGNPRDVPNAAREADQKRLAGPQCGFWSRGHFGAGEPLLLTAKSGSPANDGLR